MTDSLGIIILSAFIAVLTTVITNSLLHKLEIKRIAFEKIWEKRANIFTLYWEYHRKAWDVGTEPSSNYLKKLDLLRENNLLFLNKEIYDKMFETTKELKNDLYRRNHDDKYFSTCYSDAARQLIILQREMLMIKDIELPVLHQYKSTVHDDVNDIP